MDIKSTKRTKNSNKVQNNSLILLLAIGSFILPMHSSALVTSNGMGGGAWSAAPSWDTGVPVCGDSILIKSGDIMTIGAQQDYSACGSPMVLIIDGTLNFPGNGPKLRLPAGSTIIINVGGVISAPGAGNGNKIEIGGSWVWEKQDGEVPGYACFGACAPLPVQYLSVEAQLKEKSVCVKWMTATESNNDYFTVERSVDGTTFFGILDVNGAGTSNEILEYEAKDLEPLEGISYYRIKQTDFDGTFEYSGVVSIDVNFSNLLNVLVFPNPVMKSNDLQVSLEGVSDQQEVRVELRNINGELDHVQDYLTSENGNAVLDVSTSGRLQTGLYFISVLVDGQLQTSPVLIR